MVGAAARQSECTPRCTDGAEEKSPPNGRSPVLRKALSRMLDAGHSSALDIDAWQHSSSITFTTHVVDQGPHAIRGVDDHSARNAGSVVSGAL